MQYLLLIYGEESKRPEAPTDPDGQAAYMAPWLEYNAALNEAGVYQGANALMPTGTAATVSATGSETLVTDGPFAETKEQLGGYYLIDCETREAALEWASKCPAVKTGRVEVRPVMDLGLPE